MWDGIVNPIYRCRVRMTPGINPIHAGLESTCPRDSKNVSYVDVQYFANKVGQNFITSVCLLIWPTDQININLVSQWC